MPESRSESPTGVWSQRAVAFHAEQIAEGLHDDGCEWRPSGHYLCHCAKRARIAAGRTEAPLISWRYPVCTGCSEDLESDGDSWTCPRCHADWPYDAPDGEAGRFYDDFGDLDPDAA